MSEGHICLPLLEITEEEREKVNEIYKIKLPTIEELKTETLSRSSAGHTGLLPERDTDTLKVFAEVIKRFFENPIEAISGMGKTCVIILKKTQDVNHIFLLLMHQLIM